MREFHNSPNDMARVLVQYIDSNEKVCREIASHYDNTPCVQTVASFRHAYKTKMRRAQCDYDRTVVWMDERYEKNMAQANDAFLSALKRERAA